jgi:hypothetical protein
MVHQNQPMIPPAVLQKALDGGWKPSSVRRMTLAFLLVGPRSKAGETTHRPYLAMFALDPAFWRGLGKALGWDESYFFRTASGHDLAVYETNEAWKLNWHRFIDHLTEGKDPLTFWDDLLK